MVRILTLWVMITVTVGWGVYELKYRVIAMESKLAVISRDIASYQDDIRVLNAEWSYLNQPQVLADHNAKYLKLVPVKPKQLVDFTALPTRIAPAEKTGAVGDRGTSVGGQRVQ